MNASSGSVQVSAPAVVNTVFAMVKCTKRMEYTGLSNVGTALGKDIHAILQSLDVDVRTIREIVPADMMHPHNHPGDEPGRFYVWLRNPQHVAWLTSRVHLKAIPWDCCYPSKLRPLPCRGGRLPIELPDLRYEPFWKQMITFEASAVVALDWVQALQQAGGQFRKTWFSGDDVLISWTEFLWQIPGSIEKLENDVALYQDWMVSKPDDFPAGSMDSDIAKCRLHQQHLKDILRASFAFCEDVLATEGHPITARGARQETPGTADIITDSTNTGLKRSIGTDLLKEMFAPHGQVKYARVFEPKNATGTTYGLVRFATMNEAAQAIAAKNGERFDRDSVYFSGVAIQVKFATRCPKKQGGVRQISDDAAEVESRVKEPHDVDERSKPRVKSEPAAEVITQTRVDEEHVCRREFEAARNQSPRKIHKSMAAVAQDIEEICREIDCLLELVTVRGAASEQRHPQLGLGFYLEGRPLDEYRREHTKTKRKIVSIIEQISLARDSWQKLCKGRVLRGGKRVHLLRVVSAKSKSLTNTSSWSCCVKEAREELRLAERNCSNLPKKGTALYAKAKEIQKRKADDMQTQESQRGTPAKTPRSRENSGTRCLQVIKKAVGAMISCKIARKSAVVFCSQTLTHNQFSERLLVARDHLQGTAVSVKAFAGLAARVDDQDSPSTQCRSEKRGRVSKRKVPVALDHAGRKRDMENIGR